MNCFATARVRSSLRGIVTKTIFGRITVINNRRLVQSRFCSHASSGASTSFSVPDSTLSTPSTAPQSSYVSQTFNWCQNALSWVISVGVVGTVGSLLGAYYLNQQLFQENKQWEETRNYQKFLRHQKLPENSGVQYYIERSAKREELVQHIKWNVIFGNLCVANVIVEKGKGKTTLLKDAVRELSDDQTVQQNFQIYYVNAAHGVRSFLECEYGMEFGDVSEAAAVNKLFLSLVQMQQKEKRKVCIIVDSPGGMKEEDAMDQFVRWSKTMVDEGKGSVYIVTSPSGGDPQAAGDQFQALCKRILGERTGRYEEFDDDTWVNLNLSPEEKEELLVKVEETEKCHLDQETRKHFVKRCSQITIIGDYRRLASKEVTSARINKNK